MTRKQRKPAGANRRARPAPTVPDTALPAAPTDTRHNRIVWAGLLLMLGAAPMLFGRIAGEFDNNIKMAWIQWGAVLLSLITVLRPRQPGTLAIRFTPLHVSIVLFYAWCALSLIWAFNPVLASLYMLQFGTGIILFALLLSLINTAGRVDRLLLIASVSVIPVAVTGLCQVYWNVEWVPQVTAPAATFSNKNMACQFIAIVFPLSLAGLAVHKQLGAKAFAAASLALSLLYVAHTQNRTAPLSILLSLGILTLCALVDGSMRAHIAETIRHRRTPILIAGLVLLLSITAVWAIPSGRALVPAADLQSLYRDVTRMDRGSEKLRLIWWANTLVMVREHAVLGVGLGNFKVHYPRYHRAIERDWSFQQERQLNRVHNDHLQMLAELGGVGFVLYAGMFAVFFFMFVRVYRQSGPRARMRAAGIAAALAGGFIPVAMFDFPLERAMPVTYLFVLCALMSSLYWMQFPRTLHIHSLRRQVSLRIAACAALVVFGVWSYSTITRLIASDRHFAAAIEYSHQGEYARACNAFEQAQVFSRFNFNITLMLGQSLTQLGRYQDAINAYRECLAIHPNSINALFNTGYCHLQLAEHEQAQYYFSRYLAIMPDSPKGHNNLAITYARQGRLEQAVVHYRRAIELNPRYTEAYVNLINAYRVQNNTAAAVEAFETAAGIGLANEAMRMEIARMYFGLRRFQQTAQVLQPLMQDERADAQAFLLQGMAYQRLEHHARALELFSEAVRRDPRDAVAMYNAGLSQYLTGDIGQAENALARAAELKPDMVEPHALLGRIHMEAHEYAAALQAFLRAADADPQRLDVQMTIASLYVRLGRQAQALETYQGILQRAPHHARAHYDYARVLADIGENRQAIEHFHKALAYDDSGQINAAAVRRQIAELESGSLAR